MIKFITDVQQGEPAFDPDLFGMNLRITTLDGDMIMSLEPPYSGWTHETLSDLAELQEVMARTVNGADAFLGSAWVGSTEI